MEYKTIKNPTDSNVKVKYKGSEYELAPGQTESFPADVVNHWVSIHGFLVFASEPTIPAEEVVEEQVEEPKKKVRAKKE